MSSTFFGLNIGASALFAYSASVNTTANNVANANTKGYSKQVTNLEAKGTLRNHNYGTLGAGVDAVSITQLRNNYYDVKYWNNNSNSGQYEKKLYYMSQIENLFTDFDITKGFTTVMDSMFNSLESLKGNSGDSNIRNQFIHNTQSLAEYFNNVCASLQEIQSDANQEVRALVSEINSTAKKISVLNDKINTLEINGTYANELRDQRALLVDHLSEIVPVEVEETKVANSNFKDMYTGATSYRIRLSGQLLVDDDRYNELDCVSREEKDNQNDIGGLFDIRWKDTGNEFNAAARAMSGQLKAILDVRDGNNSENFQGILSDVSYSFEKQATVITVKDPNIKSIEAMNMPDKGYVTIGSRDYAYDGFEYSVTKNAAGNEICSYRFYITENDTSTLPGKVGRELQIGTAIDARGIPYYQTEMNEFLRSFSKQFNEIEISGNDMQGNPMGMFLVSNKPDGTENYFSDWKGVSPDNAPEISNYRSMEDTYYYMTSANFTVNARSLKDPNYFATSKDSVTDESKAELVTDLLKLKLDTVTYRGACANEFLQYITSDVSVDTDEAEILYANFTSISDTINNYRMSVFSVDEDEEALDLVKFQNAYNLASKMISTMNEMYDRLITQTGV